MQAHLEELHRRIQDPKRAIYNGQVTVIMAKEQLPSIIRAGLQLKPSGASSRARSSGTGCGRGLPSPSMR